MKLTYEHVYKACLSHPPCMLAADPFKIGTYYDLQTMSGDAISANPTFANSSIMDVYLVNGQFMPKYTVAPGEYVIMNFVHAVGDFYMTLQVQQSVMSGSLAPCTWQLLAYDGVYLSAARTTTFIAMAPGHRVTAAFQCTTAGTYYLTSNPYDSQAGAVADTEALFSQNLVTITVTGATVTMSAPTGLCDIPRPDYLTSLLTATPDSTWSVSTEQITGYNGDVLGVGTNCTLTCSGRNDCPSVYDPSAITAATCQYATFQGERGTGAGYRHRTAVGNIDQLELWGRGKTSHPFHLHVHVMQIISNTAIGSTTAGAIPSVWGQVGDWRDVFPAIVGKTVLRYRAMSYPGETV
jgi:FtsP/CotA-like multicopper oxidase with cupredoxin domain